MNDKELTKLAAKAFGVAAEGFSPLTDDGDALRLAVTLQLTVANEHVSAGVAYCLDDRHANQYPVVRSGTNQAEVIEEDYAATRRAIVRAAAEIGKEIP